MQKWLLVVIGVSCSILGSIFADAQIATSEFSPIIHCPVEQFIHECSDEMGLDAVPTLTLQQKVADMMHTNGSTITMQQNHYDLLLHGLLGEQLSSKEEQEFEQLRFIVRHELAHCKKKHSQVTKKCKELPHFMVCCTSCWVPLCCVLQLICDRPTVSKCMSDTAKLTVASAVLVYLCKLLCLAREREIEFEADLFAVTSAADDHERERLKKAGISFFSNTRLIVAPEFIAEYQRAVDACHDTDCSWWQTVKAWCHRAWLKVRLLDCENNVRHPWLFWIRQNHPSDDERVEQLQALSS